ncbi:MAG: hypothetical protein V7K25_11390 [Nostoc sp.]|uniref:hypothetical protein n=1 Tax=Nostoc sp. TaxID=1180 RepID=UPI002FF707F6
MKVWNTCGGIVSLDSGKWLLLSGIGFSNLGNLHRLHYPSEIEIPEIEIPV